MDLMLKRIRLPGFFITGTDTDVGKTVITAALANWFVRRNRRVGVCKPAATGCPRRREGLVSEDGEFLAHHADSRQPLDVVCPQRYAEPLAPAVAAERARQPLDWSTIDRSLELIAKDSDVMLVEGVGGVMVPMDKKYTVLDMIQWLGLPVLVVARPSLGTINHTLLTVRALKSSGAVVAGVIINRYPSENPSVAEETNPRVIERWSGAAVLTLTPDLDGPLLPTLPADLTEAMDRVDWWTLLKTFTNHPINEPRT